MAIQYAKCCRPIPGDTIVGQFRKGQGLVVHLRDCVTLKKQRVDSAELVDVEWAPDVQGEFDAGVRVLVSDRRGLLADLATAISDSQANIDAISMEKPDGAGVIAMFFGVQVRDRKPSRERDAQPASHPGRAQGAARADLTLATRLPTISRVVSPGSAGRALICCSLSPDGAPSRR